MRAATAIAVAVAVLGGALMAQENKPVPKGSVRVSVPGCTKGYIFTAGRRTEDEPGNVDIPLGTHVRMNGPKKLIDDIKVHEGTMIMLVGLMKKGQFADGVGVGGGVRLSPGPAPTGGAGVGVGVGGNQAFIDVEGWRQINGSCPSR